jgi:nucleoside-diphosphate-sugar epimerase
VKVLVTGGGGVLGRATVPLLLCEGRDVEAPARSELDLFDPDAVSRVLAQTDAVLHLATRIPHGHVGARDEWRENDRLRAEASGVLVDAALAGETETYVQPSVTFLYPKGVVSDEDTPLADVPDHLRSALVAERQAARFAASGRRGVTLRLGLLDGPGTAYAEPDERYGATLHEDDAGRALAAALHVPSGVYNVCRDGESVSNERFKRLSGWLPTK